MSLVSDGVEARRQMDLVAECFPNHYVAPSFFLDLPFRLALERVVAPWWGKRLYYWICRKAIPWWVYFHPVQLSGVGEMPVLYREYCLRAQEIFPQLRFCREELCSREEVLVTYWSLTLGGIERVQLHPIFFDGDRFASLWERELKKRLS